MELYVAVAEAEPAVVAPFPFSVIVYVLGVVEGVSVVVPFPTVKEVEAEFAAI